MRAQRRKDQLNNSLLRNEDCSADMVASYLFGDCFQIYLNQIKSGLTNVQ